MCGGEGGGVSIRTRQADDIRFPDAEVLFAHEVFLPDNVLLDSLPDATNARTTNACRVWARLMKGIE